MRGLAVGLLAVLAVSGGCSGTDDDGGGGPRPCEIPGATSDARTDRSGKDNTRMRVEQVRRRIEPAVVSCPGFASIGIGSLRLEGARDAPPRIGPIPRSDPYYVISVMFTDRGYLPQQPVFVDGVPVLFRVGVIRAL